MVQSSGPLCQFHAGLDGYVLFLLECGFLSVSRVHYFSVAYRVVGLIVICVLSDSRSRRCMLGTTTFLVQCLVTSGVIMFGLLPAV